MCALMNKPYSLKTAAEYLGVTVNYMYKRNDKNDIPYYKPSGKMVFYFKRDLDEWVRKNRVSSQAEMERGTKDAA